MTRRTHRSTIAAHETFEDLRKQAQNINIPEDLLTSRVDALVKRSSADLEGLSAALANAVRLIQLRVQALTTILTEIPGRADAEAALADLSERMRGVGKSLGRVEAALLAAGTSTYALSNAAAKAAVEVQGLDEVRRARAIGPAIASAPANASAATLALAPAPTSTPVPVPVRFSAGGPPRDARTEPHSAT